MSATDGSPTSTGWKRRSSAASFSMCLRYSSSVVAPTARSSPRASIGLSMLAASTAPSAAPAPTIVCSSSMKRTISPADVGDLGEDGLQPLLELAAVLGAREERADVERPDALALQALRHVAGDDALGEALGDRGLADARVADEDGVVLRAAREHLDDAADLLVAPDHRVELARLGELGEVAAELLQRLVGALGVVRGHALRAAHLRERREERVARDDVEREQQVLGGEELVLEPAHLLLGLVEQRREVGRGPRLLGRALDGRLRGERGLGAGAHVGHAAPGALDERARKLLVEQREQQVLGVDLGVAGAAGQLLRGADRLLRLGCQPREVHVLFVGSGSVSLGLR